MIAAFPPRTTLRPSSLARDEEVVLYPTCGRWDPVERCWVAPIRGWAFRPFAKGSRRDKLLRLFRKSLGLKKPLANRNFVRRAAPFIADPLPGRVIRAVAEGSLFTLGISGADGHFSGLVRLPGETPHAGRVDYRLLLNGDDGRHFEGSIQLLSPAGISVVCDIDDTLKVSEVARKKRLLANTFLEPYRAVEGVAATLRGWLAEGAAFHYLSSTPWQLYPALAQFFAAEGFPPGSLHLKGFRWRDRSFFALFASPRRTKRKALAPLLDTYPERRFVLVGDSSEKDPEIYAEVLRNHPGRVIKILIRDVEGEGAEAKRFRKAFKGLPAESWALFRDGRELAAALPWSETQPEASPGSARVAAA